MCQHATKCSQHLGKELLNVFGGQGGHTYLQSSGLSVRSSRNLFCGRMRAKQQSLLPPGGNLGRSRISRPSAIDSQLVCSATTWSGGESASRHTSRLPSMVSTRYLSFHCLNMKPPAAGKKKKPHKRSTEGEFLCIFLSWIYLWERSQV